VKGAALRDAGSELRNVVKAVQGELASEPAGPVLVSGMLADQLARELGREAEPGAVSVGEMRIDRASVLVRIIAGDPAAEDEQLVRLADEEGVPIVLVQLWPQERWTLPFVLSPFVVECRAGEGFPVGEIAARIAEASEVRQELAARIPALREAVSDRIVKEGAIRAAILGFGGGLFGSSRPLLALEQARMVARLVSLRPGTVLPEGMPAVAGIAASALGGGLALRELARVARRPLPAPLVNAGVAAGATWALGLLARRLAETGD
jgi:uncharacterized protein (DUF697 family)